MEDSLDKSVERIDSELKELHKHEARIEKIMLLYEVVANDIKSMRIEISTHKADTRQELDIIKSECMQRVGVIDVLLRMEQKLGARTK